jgi:hypothetical protein
MDLPEGQSLMNLAGVLVGALLALALLRALWRVAARALAVGCLALAAAALVVVLVGWLA